MDQAAHWRQQPRMAWWPSRPQVPFPTSCPRPNGSSKRTWTRTGGSILTDALQEPNPYIAAGEPGSERWLDQFYPTPNTMLNIEGNFYNVAYGINTTWFFYNVDMFEDLGISRSRNNYAEFLENCQVAQRRRPDRLRLPSRCLTRRLRRLVSPADRLDDHGAGPGPPRQPRQGRFAELSEVACAIRDGVYHAHLPQFRQWLELWKLRPSPTAAPIGPCRAPDPNRLFLTKNSADLGKRLLDHPATGDRSAAWTFEWATFWAPPLTTESSEYVTDPPTVAPNVGTVTDNFAISTRARKDGVLDTAIDLLRLLLSPRERRISAGRNRPETCRT